MRVWAAGRDLSDRAGLTLCAVMHNEMYFLPAFLEHYRALGVERFVVLDDRSDDGTAEMLDAQADCMRLASDVRFSDKVGSGRAIYAWRRLLLDRYCTDRWAMMIDADEFVLPPPGLSMADVAQSLERRKSQSVWGIMADAYPSDRGALAASSEHPFNLQDEWFVDARRHFWIRPGRRKPIALYRGARARLMAEYGIETSRRSGFRKALGRLGGGRFLKLNQQSKVPLVRWTSGHRLDGQHRMLPPPNVADVLPMAHFKFTGDVYGKISHALGTGSYAGKSRHYVLLAKLLERMEAEGASFLGPHSRPIFPVAELYRCGLGKWTG